MTAAGKWAALAAAWLLMRLGLAQRFDWARRLARRLLTRAAQR
jgi:hypothetical protein